MKAINSGQGDSKKECQGTSGALADGTTRESVPRWTVTNSLLAEYLSIVTKAAETAINEQATDPVEEAARALAAGFGAAMIHHGELLYGEGYFHGDLGLPGDSRTGHEAERPPLK
jgi:hypothetical protein